MVLCIILIFGLLGSFSKTAEGVVHYNNLTGAYTNLVIAIDISFDEAKGEDLIKQIKAGMTKASEVLKVATNYTKTFGEVKILIPDFWNMEVDANLTDISFSKADVKVDPKGTGAPSVYRILKACGAPGEYISLRPGYIRNSNPSHIYGAFEKTFIHEWGHFRWGLYDEYPTSSVPRFYVDLSKESIELTSCSTELTYKISDTSTGGQCEVDPNTNLYTDTCTHEYSAYDEQTAQASLMAYQHAASVVHFCDSNVDPSHPQYHNADAPTSHNKICNYSSAWDVMRAHPDFESPIETLYSDEIKFSIVKRIKPSPDLVFVLDTSGSMSGSRITELHSTMVNMINNQLTDGTFVGMVQFSSTATILSPIVEVSTATRASLESVVPSVATGGTSIGSGLKLALEMLKASPRQPILGASIMVMSDGEETTNPRVGDVENELIFYGVRVSTILFSNAADNILISLAEKTGGEVLLAGGSGTDTGLEDVFTAILQSYYQNIESPIKSIAISSVSVNAGPTETCQTFYIDSSSSNNVSFVVSWIESAAPQLRVVSPNSSEQNYPPDNTIKTRTLRCDTNPCQVGSWQICITSSADQAVKISVKTLYDSSLNETEPITLETRIENQFPNFTTGSEKVQIFAVVKRGNSAVLGAKVEAVIEAANIEIRTMNLKDSGTAADVVKDDGIYSGFLLSTNNTAKFSVIINVVGKKDKVIIKTVELDYTSHSPTEDSTTGEAFQRFAVAGLIQPIAVVAAGNQDIIPPGTITDLTVKNISSVNDTVVLTWTSVGDDFDMGNVSIHEVYLFSTLLEYRNSPGFLIETPNRTDPGTLQADQTAEMEILLNGRDLSVYAIRAVDEAGLKGDLSNPVTVTTLNLAPPAPTTTTPDPTTTTTTPDPTTTTTTPDPTTTTTTPDPTTTTTTPDPTTTTTTPDPTTTTTTPDPTTTTTRPDPTTTTTTPDPTTTTTTPDPTTTTTTPDPTTTTPDSTTTMTTPDPITIADVLNFIIPVGSVFGFLLLLLAVVSIILCCKKCGKSSQPVIYKYGFDGPGFGQFEYQDPTRPYSFNPSRSYFPSPGSHMPKAFQLGAGYSNPSYYYDYNHYYNDHHTDYYNPYRSPKTLHKNDTNRLGYHWPGCR